MYVRTAPNNKPHTRKQEGSRPAINSHSCCLQQQLHVLVVLIAHKGIKRTLNKYWDDGMCGAGYAVVSGGSRMGWSVVAGRGGLDWLVARRIKGKIIIIVYRTKTIAIGQIGKLGEPHSPIGHPSCNARLLSKVLPELVVRVLLIDIKRLNNRWGTRPPIRESIQMDWYSPWWWAAYHAAAASLAPVSNECMMRFMFRNRPQNRQIFKLWSPLATGKLHLF